MSNAAGQTQDSHSLADALPQEMARVRDDVMPEYIKIGAPGRYAVNAMRMALDRAAESMAAGDLAKMIAAYQELKGFNL